MKRIAAAMGLALTLSSCAMFGNTPAMNFEAQGSTAGIGGTAVPSGTASVSIGYTNVRLVAAPTVYTDANGNQQRLVVPNLCNPSAQDVPSVWGTSNVSASATTATAPQATLGGAEGMATGLAAELESIADVQRAQGNTHDALSDCLNHAATPTTP